MMPSCSAVVISRGGGSPLRWAASRSTANAYECTVRTSGSRTTARLPACSSADVIAARACVPSRAEPVSSRTDSGSAPAAMWAAAVSISARVLPVPGPPSTRTTPRMPGSVRAPSTSSARCGADMRA